MNFRIRKPLLLFFFLFVGSKLLSAQTDPALQSRLNTFMELNRSLQFEKLMDYIYPKLFKIAPKEQLIEVFKSTFSGDADVAVEMDSLQTGTIHPAFTIDKGVYALVDYSMLMRMKVKQDADEEKPEEKNEFMLRLMKNQYGEKNVRFDHGTGKFVIRIVTSMVAIKDELSPEWTFLNFKPSDPVSGKLLNSKVIQKLKSFGNETSE